MKKIAVALLASACLCAQTPARKPARAAAVSPRMSPALKNPSLAKATAPNEFKVQFTTTKGNIVMDLHRDWAPNGVDRFYNLVKIGFFNGDTFFRIVPNFVVQWGLNPDPAVSTAWKTASIKDDPVKEKNMPGYVTFAATAAPNSRSTQLFINFKDNSRLDSMGFAPIGIVTEGLDVAQNLYAGYGEDPDQEQIQTQGKAYTDGKFPQLDKIISAKILPETGATPAAPAKK